MAADLLHLGRYPAPVGNSRDGRDDVGDRGVARGIVAGAHVERKFAATRDDVDQTVRHRKLAHGADQRRGRSATLFDRENHFRRCRRGIVAKRHGDSARVPGDAANCDTEACRPGNRGDDADRQFALQQDGSLLDMELEIAAHRLRLARQRLDRGEIGTAFPQDRCQADPIVVAPLQNSLIEAAGYGAAAEIRRGKAHALLLGKADDVEMKGQPPAGALEMFGDDQRGQNPETAVELAGIGHRVVVRTDQQRLCRSGGARIAADNIADGIDLRLQPGRAHPFAQLRRGGFVRRREIRAHQAIGQLRPLRQLPRHIENPDTELSRDRCPAGASASLAVQHANGLIDAVKRAAT